MRLRTVFWGQETFRDDLDEYYMQLENTTNNPHLQGAIKTTNRLRHSALVNLFSKTLEFKNTYVAPARHWEAAKAYAMKSDTRETGPWTHKKPFDPKRENNRFLWEPKKLPQSPAGFFWISVGITDFCGNQRRLLFSKILKSKGIFFCCEENQLLPSGWLLLVKLYYAKVQAIP